MGTTAKISKLVLFLRCFVIIFIGSANDDLDLETEAARTQFEADEDSKNALITLFDGDQWMIYRNVLTGVLHWDFVSSNLIGMSGTVLIPPQSVLGRFISFPAADKQATGSINTNLTEVRVLGENWQSDKLINIVGSLNQSTTNANAGSLNGNRMFWNNDYMVRLSPKGIMSTDHDKIKVNRGSGYVSTIKMYSIRTQNTECNNSQNVSSSTAPGELLLMPWLCSLWDSICQTEHSTPTFKAMNTRIFPRLGIGTLFLA